MRKIIATFIMMLCAACVASAANNLTFTAEEDGSSFGIVNNEGNNPDVQYSLDGGKTWTTLAARDTITLSHKGDKALLKGNNPQGFSKNVGRYSSFTMTGEVAASGSVMSLIDGTGLSTKIPNNYCFHMLFNDCTSRTRAPELPADSLTYSCYYNMFYGCTSLTRAPELPAMTLAEACYEGMFVGCTSLTQAPELPAVTLANYCYAYMFRGCTSLTRAPELSAMTLAEACYAGMFVECTSLAQAPALPATTLPTTSGIKGGCYGWMFSGCTSLSQIRVSFDDWNDGLHTAKWVEDVAPTGTFYCPKALPLEYGVSRIPEGWTVKYIDDTVAVETNYLTFTAEEDGSTFGIINEGGNNPDIQYSLDGGETWTALAAGDTITLAHKGDKALLRGDNPEGISGYSECSSFTMTGKIAASGSVMSLIDGVGLSTEVPGNFCFYKLFQGCTSLTQAPELPATEMTFYCYNCMFKGCTSLTQAPELPATTLFENCYSGMFSGCTSLTRAPELPAKEFLGKYSYSGMFSGCTSLSEINVSFDDWDKLDATFEWVADVAPTGTFICPKTLALEYGISWIPEGWTVKYIEDMANYLTFTAEEDGSTFGIANNGGNNPDIQYSLDGGETWTSLAAGDTITLAHKGDKALLRGDNPEGFSKDYEIYSSFTMTGKIAASGSVMSLIDNTGETLVVPAAACFCKLFYGCTSLTQAPELPATTLAGDCYLGMFRGCTSLTQAPALPATTLAEGCCARMFDGCTSLTQAPELPATTLLESCYAYMFSGCTSLSEIKVSFDDWDYGMGTRSWVEPVAPTGTFYCPKALPLEYGVNRIPEGWTVKFIDDTVASEPNYLTFTAEEDGSTFGIVNKYKNNPNVQYSLDGGETWTSLAEGKTVMLAHKGDKALLRGNNPEGFSKDYDHYSAFKMTGKVAASGSVMSLVDGLGVTTAIPNEGCFSYLFFDCSALTQAPELPATTLAERCYEGMFFGCTSLTQAPALPATKLTEKCYCKMFFECTSLTQAPELPATTLADRCYFEMFRVCTSLTQAPELPAMTLAEGCYALMFSDCTSLTQAPELPAITLPATSDAESGCYFGMFSDCTSLTQAPALPATTLAESCYGHMFLRCTNLTQAPELPATTLAKSCYEGMFNGCTSLTQAPALPATTLAEGCYLGMFWDCTSLMQAPALPATTLAGHCYTNMFISCTSLTQAPELPATTLAESCYYSMFSGCTSLSEINVSFDDWAFDMGTPSWVRNVARTGTFICPKGLPLEYGVDRIPEGWTVKYIDDTVAVETNYLTFTAEEDGSSFGIVSNEGNNPDVQYSLDGGKTWTTLAVKDAITLAHKGDKALLRGDNPDGFSRFLSPWTMYTSFTMTGKIAASGSVMSLIDGIGETLVIPNDICFYKLFFGCASLTQAPELPATTLAGSCYEGMFSGCTSLTQAPKLPATTLAKECYREMFRGCTSLAQAPKLPATTLAGYCYCGMFDGCTGLTEAPELPVTTLAEWCYYGMFSGCTRLTQAPVLPANTLAGYCYSRMFQGCTSLTQAPALPATTLSGGCYSAMFRGCTNLTQAPELPATTLAGGCYSSMFSGCTSLAQAPELPATTMAFHCYEYMFYGCTSLTKAPELPATELPDSLFMRGGCCESMFSGCTNLSEISIAFDKWNDNTFEWVKDVAPTGTFICPKELPLEYGVNRIPEGWTVKYVDEGSGVSSALADGVTVWTDDLTIFVRGAEGEVSLYDVSGRIVATSNSKDEERALCVPSKGVYMVRTNNGTSVVLVR